MDSCEDPLFGPWAFEFRYLPTIEHRAGGVPRDRVVCSPGRLQALRLRTSHRSMARSSRPARLCRLLALAATLSASSIAHAAPPAPAQHPLADPTYKLHSKRMQLGGWLIATQGIEASLLLSTLLFAPQAATLALLAPQPPAPGAPGPRRS